MPPNKPWIESSLFDILQIKILHSTPDEKKEMDASITGNKFKVIGWLFQPASCVSKCINDLVEAAV